MIRYETNFTYPKVKKFTNAAKTNKQKKKILTESQFNKIDNDNNKSKHASSMKKEGDMRLCNLRESPDFGWCCVLSLAAISLTFRIQAVISLGATLIARKGL